MRTTRPLLRLVTTRPRRALAAAAATAAALMAGVAPASASGSAAWRAVPLPNLGGGLDNLLAPGPSSARAVGSQIPDDPIVLHWNGRGWSTGPTTGLTPASWRTYPAGVTVRGIVEDPLFVTPDDAWSIGITGLGTSAFSPLLLHFNGRTWFQVEAPPVPLAAVSGTLSGIVAGPGGQLWLSGSWQPCSFFSVCANTPFVVRGRPGAWRSEPLPPGITAIAGLSPDRAGRPQWITATTSDTGSSHYLYFHGGAWTLVPGVAIAGQVQPHMTVAHIPGTNLSWAVGWAHDGPLISSLVHRIEVNGALP